jgi:formylglycine-generating enzyme required for sulfatase activity
VINCNGQLWEWTNSAYLAYPGFNKLAGALGEYNGKFMINQMILRGASVGTAKDIVENISQLFTHMRWQFNGLRLVK